MHIDRPLVFSKTRNETFAEYAYVVYHEKKEVGAFLAVSSGNGVQPRKEPEEEVGEEER